MTSSKTLGVLVSSEHKHYLVEFYGPDPADELSLTVGAEGPVSSAKSARDPALRDLFRFPARNVAEARVAIAAWHEHNPGFEWRPW